VNFIDIFRKPPFYFINFSKIIFNFNFPSFFVFNVVLKVCREFDDVTSAGKLFHVRAAATGNARSPTVDSRVDVTSNAEVDDRRLCRPGILATG